MSADSSASLPSGLHRYAGDPSNMKLRLIFTDQGLFSSRPSFKGSKCSQQQQQQNQRAESVRRNNDGCSSGLTNYHSSYLIVKHNGSWRIRREVGANLLEANGWRLSILNEPLNGPDLFCCSEKNWKKSKIKGRTVATATTNSKSISEKHKLSDFKNIGDNNSNQGKDDDETSKQPIMGDESSEAQSSGIATRSKRAFNWAETVRLADVGECQRTLASRLPDEMRNHQLYFRHHCLAGHKITKRRSEDDACDDSSHLFSSLCACGFSDCGDKIADGCRQRRDEDGNSCDDELPTDLYRQWLLNGNQQGDLQAAATAFSERSCCFVGKTCEQQSSLSSLSPSSCVAANGAKKSDYDVADDVNNSFVRSSTGAGSNTDTIEALQEPKVVAATSVGDRAAATNGTDINIHPAHEYNKGIKSGDDGLDSGGISEGGDMRQKVGLQQQQQQQQQQKQHISPVASIVHDKSTLSNSSMLQNKEEFNRSNHITMISDATDTCSPEDTTTYNNDNYDNVVKQQQWHRQFSGERSITSHLGVGDTRKPQAVTRARCSHAIGEVLYIIMEKHEICSVASESLTLSQSSSSAKTQRLRVEDDVRPDTVASATCVSIDHTANDATVSSKSTNNHDMDKEHNVDDKSSSGGDKMTLVKRKSDDKCDSKVQELQHHGSSSSSGDCKENEDKDNSSATGGSSRDGGLHSQSDRAKDQQRAFGLERDKLVTGNKGAHAEQLAPISLTKLATRLSDLNSNNADVAVGATNDDDGDAAALARSRDEEGEREIDNLRAIKDQSEHSNCTGWMQQEHELRQRRFCRSQRCCLLNRHNDGSNGRSKLVCLAVIVIDVLKRFIQMKPDLNKLISVDIKPPLVVGARFCDASATDDGTSAKQADTRDRDTTSSNSDRSSNLLIADNRTNLKLTTPIRSSLLYLLEAVPEDLSTAAATGRAEANWLMADLMQMHLSAGAVQLNPQRTDIPLGGLSTKQVVTSFAGPVNGGVLIKLQFDIHFASEFPEDCRNLHARYKLIVNESGRQGAEFLPNKSSKWKLRRSWVDVKEETVAECGLPTSNVSISDEKLAQMTHYSMATQQTAFSSSPSLLPSLTSLPSTTEVVVADKSSLSSSRHLVATASQQLDDESKKSIKFVTESTKSDVLSVVGGDADACARRSDDCDGDGNNNNNNICNNIQMRDVGNSSTVMTTHSDTCLLEGSTINSQPDSRGRFQFACVEELLLEFVTDDNNIKWSTATQQRSLKSSSVSQVMSTLARPPMTQKSYELADSERATVKLSSTRQEIVVESALGAVDDDKTTIIDDTKTSLSLTDDVSPNINEQANQRDPLPNRQLAQLSNAREMFITETAATTAQTSQDSSSGYESNKRSNEATHFNSLDHDLVSQISGVKRLIGAREVLSKEAAQHINSEQLLLGDSVGSICDDQSDDNIEIVLIVELYSKDFFLDRLQGWTHLCIPVSLNRTVAKPPQRLANSSKTTCPTRYELPVLMPELNSIVDKLRYYLIGLLPPSRPPIELFARSNNRYMLQSRQSGTLVLDCDITRQFSDPNFDSALDEFMQIGKKRPFGSNRQSIAYSPMTSNRSDELDTERVIRAYQQAKHRIENLNISAMLKS